MFGLVLFVVVCTVYSASAARNEMHMDAHAAAVESWHIATTGSPWLEGDLDEQMRSNPFIGKAPNGHVVALRMAGPVLAAIPFYGVLGSSQFGFVPGGIAGAFWSALTVSLMYAALRSRSSRGRSVLAAAAFGFATPVWTVAADQPWTHTVTLLGIAGAAFGASRERWWIVGLFLALAMLGRPHIAIVAATLGIGVGLAQRKLAPTVAIAVPTLCSLGLLLAWSRAMFGSWSVAGGYGDKMSVAASGFAPGADSSGQAAYSWSNLPVAVTNHLGFWLSLDRGLLVWTPALMIMAVPLFRSWAILPVWSRWLLVGGALYTVVQLRVNAFPGGDNFWGYRYGLEFLACAFPALAFSAAKTGFWARNFLVATLAAQFGAMTVGAISRVYYIPVKDVWVDNSLWAAFRDRPDIIGSWMLACVCAALLAHWLYLRSSVNVRPLAIRSDE